MRVVVSVNGRFHGFDLAAQLYKRGHLDRLITSYPKYKVKEWGIPSEYIVSFLSVEIMKRAWARSNRFLSNSWDATHWMQSYFDRKASGNIQDDTDIFTGWSSSSLLSIKIAKAKGILTVLERGSTHIEYQRDILVEEYERYGQSIPRLPTQSVVERELEEYQLSDYISMPSQFARNTFLNRGFSADKLIVVPYGVDLSNFCQLPKKDNTFRLIFAGGMSLRKGVHYLLQAFAELDLSGA